MMTKQSLRKPRYQFQISFLCGNLDNMYFLIQIGISGAEYIRKRKEKSTAILVAIILVFLVCHIHRLVFRIYEMALPEKSVFEHYTYCNERGRYHVPVAIYFLTHSLHLFLVINSSINFVIYCFMGRQFRKKLMNLLETSTTHNQAFKIDLGKNWRQQIRTFKVLKSFFLT